MVKGFKSYLVLLSFFLNSTLFLISASTSANAEYTSLFDVEEEFTQSVTRLSQKYKNTPSSVTVIKGETLKSLQISDIPEALRLVPGMSVGLASGNDYRISYHGGSGLIPRRMQVLVDGLPIYRSGYAKVDWKTIGVSIDDIDKIEVVRSPSSATYGANSFQAVVNIKTKPVKSALVNELDVGIGDLGTQNMQYRFGTVLDNGNAFRLTLSQEQDEGYDTNFQNEDRRDDSNIKSVNLKTEAILPSDYSMTSQFGLVTGTLENEFADNNQLSFPDIEVDDVFFLSDFIKERNSTDSQKLSVGFTRNEWKQDWETCYPTFLFLPEMRELMFINRQYTDTILAGGTPVGETAADEAAIQNALAAIGGLGDQAFQANCGVVNQDVRDEKTHIEFQDIRQLTSNLRTVTGIGLDYTSFDSETYTNGRVTYFGGNIFSNAELIYNDFVFNAGLMAEKDKNTDGVEYSPRIGINYHVGNGHTLRLIYSEAIRTPDLLENQRDWNYYMRGFSNPFNGLTEGYFFLNSASTHSLQSEKIESQEISYYGKIQHLDLQWDLKIFKERLTDLIAEKLQFFDYNPTNNAALKNKGAEIEINYRGLDQVGLGMSYSYIDSESNNFFETTLSSRHIGSVYSVYNISDSVVLSGAYYGSSSISGFSYDRFDVGLIKSFQYEQDKEFEIGFLLQHLRNSLGYVVDEGFSVENIYDDKNQLTFNLRVDI